jgi:hypothetical protein
MLDPVGVSRAHTGLSAATSESASVDAHADSSNIKAAQIKDFIINPMNK